MRASVSLKAKRRSCGHRVSMDPLLQCTLGASGALQTVQYLGQEDERLAYKRSQMCWLGLCQNFWYKLESFGK